jgi:Ca-activated chloride channel family protein
MKRVIMAAIAVVVLSSSVFALGALYARRPSVDENMQPLWLERYTADATITDQIAVTHVDQTFKNETSNRLEGIFIFPLPQGAIVTELALWVNGVRVVASIKENDTARAIYNSVVQKSIDPALLEYMGQNVFKLSVFPIEAIGNTMSERRIEITYAELLPYASRSADYRFFMKTVNLSPKPVQQAALSYTLTSQKKILSLFSPTYEASPAYSVTKTSDYKYQGVFGSENAQFDKDFELVYQFESKAFSLNNLTYVPSTTAPMFFDSTGDKPYYVLWVTTPDSAKVMAKNVVFIADVSSSMAGTRIAQVKSALKNMVAMLNKGDKFNIVAFSTGTQLFASGLIASDSAGKASAGNFIDQLTELGLTDMEDAFKAGLASAWNDTCVNSMVFLTDGKPTWPVTSTTQSVRDTVKAYNKKGVAVYSFGIGDDVDGPFLTQLSLDNNGSATMIGTDTVITTVLAGFMQTISYPLIKNCSISYGGLPTYDVLPNPLPNLVATTQLTVLGRYSGAGTYNVSFKGVSGKDSMAFSQPLAFPSSVTNQPFVPRMWASAKINSLLDQIGLYGASNELVNAVKALGLKYSIVTPYTSLIAVETGTTVRPGQISEDKTAPKQLSLQFVSMSNPVRSMTTIRYAVPVKASPQQVSIKIFDARGRLVKTLVNDLTMGGNFMVKWDAKDSAGKKVPAGFYFAVLEAGQARSMVQMRVM